MKTGTIQGLVLAAMSAAVLTAGCSPTGWTVRQMPDGSDLQPGQSVTVIQGDGSTISGEYLGMASIPWDTYAEQYQRASFAPVRGEMLPALNQTVQFTVSLTDTRHWTGQLAGFDLENMWVILPGNSEPQPVYFSSIKSLSSADGHAISRLALRGLFVNGDIPLRSALKLKAGTGEVAVPVSSIRRLAMADGIRFYTTVEGDALPQLRLD